MTVEMKHHADAKMVLHAEYLLQYNHYWNICRSDILVLLLTWRWIETLNCSKTSVSSTKMSGRHQAAATLAFTFRILGNHILIITILLFGKSSKYSLPSPSSIYVISIHEYWKAVFVCYDNPNSPPACHLKYPQSSVAQAGLSHTRAICLCKIGVFVPPFSSSGISVMEWIGEMIEARNTGELREQTDRQRNWERRGWWGGWNHSFYMLSGFNLVRAIILQFTEVANQMSVCLSAVGLSSSFLFFLFWCTIPAAESAAPVAGKSILTRPRLPSL